MVDKYPGQVRSCLTGQGKERKLKQMPASLVCQLCPITKLSKVEPDSTELLFGDCLEVLDHLHLFQNALQSGLTGLSWWSGVETSLRHLVDSFASQSHRARSQHTCLNKLGKKLKLTWRHQHVDWRWEVLEVVLEDALSARDWLAFFDCETMCGKEKVPNALYSEVDRVKNDQLFWKRARVISAVCKRSGVWTRWLDGCWCHEAIFTSSSSCKLRQKHIWEAGAQGCTCFWQGRRGVELVLGVVDQIVPDFMEVLTDDISDIRSQFPAATSVERMSVAELLVVHMASAIELKLSLMWKTLPGMLIGIFGEVHGIRRCHCQGTSGEVFHGV